MPSRKPWPWPRIWPHTRKIKARPHFRFWYANCFKYSIHGWFKLKNIELDIFQNREQLYALDQKTLDWENGRGIFPYQVLDIQFVLNINFISGCTPPKRVPKPMIIIQPIHRRSKRFKEIERTITINHHRFSSDVFS